MLVEIGKVLHEAYEPVFEMAFEPKHIYIISFVASNP